MERTQVARWYLWVIGLVLKDVSSEISDQEGISAHCSKRSPAWGVHMRTKTIYEIKFMESDYDLRKELRRYVSLQTTKSPIDFGRFEFCSLQKAWLTV